MPCRARFAGGGNRLPMRRAIGHDEAPWGGQMAQALRVGVFSPSIVLRVARSAGVLSRYGVEVVEQPVPSSTEQFRALLDGALDAVLTSPDNVVAYRLLAANPLRRTADVRILLGIDRGLGLALYGRPDEDGLPDGDGGFDGEGVADLRGGVVGVDVAESGFAFALYEILAASGLRRNADYRVVELGATPRRADALIAGRCDATMLNAGSDLRAAEHGCRLLRRAADVCQPYLGTVLAATGTACERDAVRLGALVAALRTVLGRLTDPAREPDRGMAVAAATGALRLGPAAAQRYVAGLRSPTEGLIGSGEPDEAALATVLALRRRHSRLPGLADLDPGALPAGLLDRRFLLAADRQ
jgi:ABC-type nitrate/sulfonate/bicarbonate transport system substrate-binding protein